MDRIDQAPPQPTPSADALTEADHLDRMAANLYALAANDAEQAGDEHRAQDLWQRADQNLTPAGAVTA
jgi:hypothetical protein